MRKLLNLMAVVTLMSAGTAAADEIVKWVDDNGVVNYAERKPRGVPENRITVIAGSNAQAATASTAKKIDRHL